MEVHDGVFYSSMEDEPGALVATCGCLRRKVCRRCTLYNSLRMPVTCVLFCRAVRYGIMRALAHACCRLGLSLPLSFTWSCMLGRLPSAPLVWKGSARLLLLCVCVCVWLGLQRPWMMRWPAIGIGGCTCPYRVARGRLPAPGPVPGRVCAACSLYVVQGCLAR